MKKEKLIEVVGGDFYPEDEVFQSDLTEKYYHIDDKEEGLDRYGEVVYATESEFEEEGWVITQDEDVYTHPDFMWESDLTGDCWSNNTDMCEYNNGNAIAEEGELERSDMEWCVDIEQYAEDYRIAEDSGEAYYYFEDELYYHGDGYWYTYPEESLQYGFIYDYHCSPSPEHILNSKDSKFTIGFEIEKDEIDEEPVTNLFKGVENDGSCGHEAITNILPLSYKDKENVFKLFEKENYIITTCPTNNRCGGHVHIGIKGKSGDDLKRVADKMKNNFIPILYALYRKRLKNTYSGDDVKLKDKIYRYAPVNFTSRTIEFRLVSKVKSVTQLKNRYELFLIGLNNYETQTLEQMWGGILPTLQRMYDNDNEKISELFQIAKDFRDWLLCNEKECSPSERIKEFIENND